MARLRPGQSGVRMPAGARDYFLLQNVHAASHSVGTEVLSGGKAAGA